ncbi:uncharacterized protein B0J16DRAFT_288163 [Fusarium flagelliforme]|uniref:uncharacterized protein n=1 Tax=Fusarium flagelliforme TaxID=2675880 RepID=UPI001E8D81DE|nr:uncharacterized protein B0J16DRAFT_288163 [Fusarium flagelliforme]KAH7186201.1 hypothetical protein B0J16DRAFT_288163 [Fusarium flagelliforme]
MHFSGLLLALATTASAVDMRAWIGSSCEGAFVACVGLNPNVCCVFSNSANSGRASISVNAIPSNWNIHTQANTGGGCTYMANEQDNNGRTDLCMAYNSRGDRTGGSYWFNGRKRAADKSCPAEQAEGKCEATVEPNALGLTDGTMYDIAGLSAEKVQELEKIAIAGASADAVPAEFKILEA